MMPCVTGLEAIPDKVAAIIKRREKHQNHC